MSASRLPEYASLAWVFLAYRESGQWKGDWRYYKHLLPSSATVSHVLGQTDAAGLRYPKNSWTRERKDFSLHNLNSSGDSLTCLLKDCLNIPCLPEYNSFVVSKDNGKVTGNVTSLFCHSATCLGTNQCCWVRNHTPVLHECSPVRSCKGAAYDPVSNKNFPYTLATCTWLCHVACIQKTLGQERERTSHFTIWTTWVILWHVCFKTAWICLACLSIPRLSWVRSERWLAMLQTPACDSVLKKTFPIWAAVKTSAHSWDHPTFEISLRFFNFHGFGDHEASLGLKFLAFLSAIRIEKKEGIVWDQNWEKEGYCFWVSHSLTGFWHLMTGDIVNQTSEALRDTDTHIHLQPVHGCAMLIASRKLLDKREKGLLTSQFEQLGWFCHMSASRLPEYASLAWVFLAYRESGQWKGGWQCCKHLLPQCHMSWDRPILLG